MCATSSIERPPKKRSSAAGAVSKLILPPFSSEIMMAVFLEY
jgi:hypothetical protein